MKNKHVIALSCLGLAAVISAGTVFYSVFSMVQGTTSAATCTVDAKLINSCRPWIGAAADAYPGITQYDFKAQILGHEARLGRQVDLPHHYIAPGAVLSNSHKYFINRADTYLMLNWKPVKDGGPSNTWRDADGRDATVNANIDNLANSIKSVAPKKLFLTVFHEPENDVSPGGSPGCGSSITYVGNMGTTAEYARMWENVRNRFDALGVSNVVWVFNPMGFDRYDCMVSELWPGNDRVDWITYDQYIYDSKEISNTGIGKFYTYLTNNSNATHNYLSKPWGLNEWGATASTPAVTYAAYNKMKVAFEANQFPKLQMYNIWDNIVGSDNWQVQYNPVGVIDQAEQNAYNAFANAVFARGVTQTPPPVTPTPETPTTPTPTDSVTTPPPTATPTTPNPTEQPVKTVTAPTGEKVVDAQASGAIEQGQKTTLDQSTVTDKAIIAKIQKVEFYDGKKLVATVTKEPFVLDTALLTPGEHTITQRTIFKDGTSQEKTQTIEVKGLQTTAKDESHAAELAAQKTSPLITIIAAAVTVILGSVVFGLQRSGILERLF